MDPLSISRWQFGITTIYHFFFVPLTLGLGWFVAIMQTQYYRTNDEKYHQLAKFWGKLFLINFAMGVVTGIVQEFQFGMNWSEYSRFVGDIFGAPLAIEALLAFFLESTFLGLWIFGEGRVPKGVHLMAIWMVVLGSNLSALWILIANGWMQHPVGYAINPVTGRPQLVDFFALISNPKAWVFFWHTLASGLVTASFFVLGISAWHLFRKHSIDVFRISFKMAAVIGLFATIAVIVGGHQQGAYMNETQPMKMAAVEALWDTEQPASFSLLTIGDLSGKALVWQVRIPKLLSLIACNNLTCLVRGVNDVQAEYTASYGPGDYVPLMVVTYWTFRFMITSGFLMLFIAAFATWWALKDFPEKPWKLTRWGVWLIALPYIANTSGWILTEMGRQPWIVQGLLTTAKGVSPISATLVLTSLVGFTLIYGALMVADIYLLRKEAKAGIEVDESKPVDVVPSLLSAQD